MRQDDLILEADGARVTTASELQSAVRAHKEGETVRLRVYRIPGLTTIKSTEKIPAGEYIEINVAVALMD